jgi:B12-binding domain/radical SAM domain protein
VRLTKQTDLVLLHPPSVYDFREKLIIPSPIADLVPSGPFFEMYPIGFSFLGEYLERHGMKVRVINLAARMLEQPSFDVERHLSRLDPRAFGISLHWLPHCHGAVEIARLCKRTHPDIPVIMGGYSSTIFHRELLEYPEIDFVVRGDSTEEPLLKLMTAIREGGGYKSVPNLTWRDKTSGQVLENPLDYVPRDLSHIGGNYVYMMRAALRHGDLRGVRAFKGWWSYPMTAVLTCKGCLKNCTFCGGSARAMSKCFSRRGIALRSPLDIAKDVKSINAITGAPIFMIGDIRQPGDDYANEVLDHLGRLAPKNHMVLELFEPAPREYFERAGRNLPHFDLEISPETHDEGLRRAAGKPYTNEQLESNITWALENGCCKVDVFFMIGIEGQDRESVMNTIEYCSYLLKEFGTKVNPLVGPLAPFLDPGSINRTDADRHGYTVLLHSLEDHRRALLEPHWRDLLGYRTECMDRQEIVDATYQALLELNRVKASHGQISASYAESMEKFLLDTIALLGRLDSARDIGDGTRREAELAMIKLEADQLRVTSDLVKEELEWPIEGAKFRYLSIAKLLLGRRRAA